MSPSFSTQHLPEAGDALRRLSFWKMSTPFSTAAIAFSPICMTIRLRMLAQVRPKIEASSLMMPLMSKVSGSSMPASPS